MQKSKANSELAALYDAYCSSALNKDYYGAMLRKYQRWNIVIEIALASTASGSGISALTIWNDEHGKLIWGTLTLITGFLAVAKPFLQLHQRIENYSKLFTGHLDNFLQLHRIVSSVSRQQDFDQQNRAAFERAFERYIELSRGDDPQINARVHAKCEQAVRAQFPRDSMWWPDIQTATLSVVESKSNT